MKILELLKQVNYPQSWIQGHHTRIVVYSNGDFETLTKHTGDGHYTVSFYDGNDEEEAVKQFIVSEEA